MKKQGELVIGWNFFISLVRVSGFLRLEESKGFVSVFGCNWCKRGLRPYS